MNLLHEYLLSCFRSLLHKIMQSERYSHSLNQLLAGKVLRETEVGSSEQNLVVNSDSLSHKNVMFWCHF
jgi:hypothetical protein